MWLLYSAHQIFIWALIYKAQLEMTPEARALRQEKGSKYGLVLVRAFLGQREKDFGEPVGFKARYMWKQVLFFRQLVLNLLKVFSFVQYSHVYTLRF